MDLEAFDREIAAAVGERRYLRAAADMQGFLEDWRGRFRGTARGVALPADTAEVAAVVAACARHGIALTPQSGNTGLVGGAIPGGPGGEEGERTLLLSLSRMNRVREVDLDNDTVTVEAGVILANLRDFAEENGRSFPVNLGSAGSCQVGGLVSTNAGGTEVLRYGNMREQVLGLEVVLPDGRIWDGLYGLRKDNSGYDLKQLFIGAEGTLGVVTAAVLKLSPRNVVRATAMAAFAEFPDVLALLKRFRAAFGNRIEGFEVMSQSQLDIVLRHGGGAPPLDPGHPWYAMIEVADAVAGWDAAAALEAELAEGFEAGLVLDAVIASDLAKAERIWALRHTISESNKTEGFTVSNDTSVPISRLPEFLAAVDARCAAELPGVIVCHVGHVGDGNVHVILIFPHGTFDPAEKEALAARANGLVHEESLACRGSIAAEHGIGLMHVRRLGISKDPVALDLMGRVKAALDPQRIMNPGKILARP